MSVLSMLKEVGKIRVQLFGERPDDLTVPDAHDEWGNPIDVDDGWIETGEQSWRYVEPGAKPDGHSIKVWRRSEQRWEWVEVPERIYPESPAPSPVTSSHDGPVGPTGRRIAPGDPRRIGKLPPALVTPIESGDEASLWE